MWGNEDIELSAKCPTERCHGRVQFPMQYDPMLLVLVKISPELPCRRRRWRWRRRRRVRWSRARRGRARAGATRKGSGSAAAGRSQTAPITKSYAEKLGFQLRSFVSFIEKLSKIRQRSTHKLRTGQKRGRRTSSDRAFAFQIISGPTRSRPDSPLQSSESGK